MPDPSLLTAVSNGSPPPVPPAPAGQDVTLVAVFLTTGVRTSGGNGPGVVRVPQPEASRLIASRLGVAGDQAPMGYLGPFGPA